MDQDPRLGSPRRLEESLGGQDVAGHVLLEPVPASQEAGHGRLVKDGLNPVEGGGEVAVAKVELEEAEAGPIAKAGEIALLAAALIVRVENVETSHIVAIGQQPLTQVRADEPRRSGDQTAHRDLRAD